MAMAIAWFVHPKKGEGLSHVVDMEKRVSLCGLSQKIGSTMKTAEPMDTTVQCNKCRKSLQNFYSPFPRS